jgi:hypothetical protein
LSLAPGGRSQLSVRRKRSGGRGSHRRHLRAVPSPGTSTKPKLPKRAARRPVEEEGPKYLDEYPISDRRSAELDARLAEWERQRRESGEG